MKIINFVNPDMDREIKSKLTTAISADWLYPQVCEYLAKDGYYVPFDQFNALRELFNIQLDLDIGARRGENS